MGLLPAVVITFGGYVNLENAGTPYHHFFFPEIHRSKLHGFPEIKNAASLRHFQVAERMGLVNPLRTASKYRHFATLDV